jgi:hypothetical protein
MVDIGLTTATSTPPPTGIANSDDLTEYHVRTMFFTWPNDARTASPSSIEENPQVLSIELDD